MDGVRLVARIFAVVGWLTLIIGGLGLMALATQLGSAFGSRGGGLATLGTLAAGAVPLLAVALGPFFLWALLTALCEIHAQLAHLGVESLGPASFHRSVEPRANPESSVPRPSSRPAGGFDQPTGTRPVFRADT